MRAATCEPCAAHGMALTKGRPRGSSLDIVGCAHSFACFMRSWKASQAFRDQLIAIVSKSLIIKHEPRPAENIMKTKRLIKLLYNDEHVTDTNWLHKRRTKDGHSKKSPLLEDVEALGSVVDLGVGDLSTVTFWAHGLGLEAAFACSSQEGRQVIRAACVEDFVVPLFNLLVNRSWDSSAVSRCT